MPPTPLISTTQNLLDVQDVTSDLVFLKSGSAALILEVSAINFGLLSEREQDATIYSYSQLLNSLTFSIQIVLISKQKDISDYIKLLNERIKLATNPLIKNQLEKYRDFVKSVVRQGNVLDKKFYFIIPFSSLELGARSALQKTFDLTEAYIEKVSMNLHPKRDHLIRLLSRIGLKAHQIKSAEILQLLFNLYNRDLIGTKVKLPEKT